MGATSTWDVSTEDGFLAWYDATVVLAHRYAARLCGSDHAAVEDVVQDAYLSVLRQARSGSLAHATAGLITTAVRTRFLDRVRAGASDARRIQLVWSQTAADVEHHEQHDPTATLPPHERAALVLRHVEGLSVPDVAAELGLTIRATESLLARARARARREVRGHG